MELITLSTYWESTDADNRVSGVLPDAVDAQMSHREEQENEYWF